MTSNLAIVCNRASHPLQSSCATAGIVQLVHKLRTIVETNKIADLVPFCTSETMQKMGYLLIEWTARKEEWTDELLRLGAKVSRIAAQVAFVDGKFSLINAYLEQNGSYPPNILNFTTAFLDLDEPKLGKFVEKLIDNKTSDYPAGSAVGNAACHDDIRHLKHLLNNGYAIDPRSLDWASSYDHACLLIEHNTPFSLFSVNSLARKGWPDLIRKVVALGAPIAKNALNCAMWGDKSKVHLVVDTLIELGAPIDDKVIAEAIQTGQGQDDQLVEKLMRYGAKINGYALAAALERKNPQLFEKLLSKKGAEPDIHTVRAAIRTNNLPLLVRLTQELGIPLGDDSLLYIPQNCSKEIFYYLLDQTKDIPKGAFTQAFLQTPVEKSEEFTHALLKRGGTIDLTQIDSFPTWQHLALLKALVNEHGAEGKIKLSSFFFSEKPSINNFREFLEFEDIELDFLRTKKMAVDFRNELISHVAKKLHSAPEIQAVYPTTEDDVERLVQLLEDTKRQGTILMLEKNWDLFDWIKDILLSLPNHRLSLADLAIHWLPGTPIKWKMVFPHFDGPKEIAPYSTWGFDPKVYKELLPLTQEADKKEKTELSEINAYKLAVLFASKENAVKYLKAFERRNPDCQTPIQEACKFSLPKSGIWNRKAWRELAEKHGYSAEILELLPSATQLERAINGVLPSYKTAEKQLKHGVSPADYYERKILKIAQQTASVETENSDELIWATATQLFPKEMQILEEQQRQKPLDATYLNELLTVIINYRDLSKKSFEDFKQLANQEEPPLRTPSSLPLAKGDRRRASRDSWSTGKRKINIPKLLS